MAVGQSRLVKRLQRIVVLCVLFWVDLKWKVGEGKLQFEMKFEN